MLVELPSQNLMPTIQSGPVHGTQNYRSSETGTKEKLEPGATSFCWWTNMCLNDLSCQVQHTGEVLPHLFSSYSWLLFRLSEICLNKSLKYWRQRRSHCYMSAIINGDILSVGLNSGKKMLGCLWFSYFISSQYDLISSIRNITGWTFKEKIPTFLTTNVFLETSDKSCFVTDTGTKTQYNKINSISQNMLFRWKIRSPHKSCLV